MRAAYAALARAAAQTPATEFLDEWLQPGVTRAVVQERLRAEIAEVRERDRATTSMSTC